MRTSVLATIAGGVAVIIATVPASAFNSGTDPVSYYDGAVGPIDAHRAWLGNQGVAFQSADGFARRQPDDEFDSQLLSLINQFRTDNGLPGIEQFETLRVQSAMWSNRMADAGNSDLEDTWYRHDAEVACRQLGNVVSAQATTSGTAEDVLNQWLMEPAILDGLLMSGSVWAGIGSVEVQGQRWVTARIVSGSCPGTPAPYSVDYSPHPIPTLQVRPLNRGSALEIVVDSRLRAATSIEVQALASARWVLWASDVVDPRTHTITVDPPGGTYRVVVPEQQGYGVAISPLLRVR